MVRPSEPGRPDAERLRRQRMRSLAIALGLGAMVVIFYAATIVRLGPNAMNRDARAVRSGNTVVVPEGQDRVAPPASQAPASQPAASQPPAAQPAAPATDCKKAGTC